jgi:hypothetical protein
MTVVILAKCKNSIIVSTDLQESGHVLDYNNIFLEETREIDNKTYYPIDNNKRLIGTNLTSKISEFGNIMFSGAGDSEFLKSVELFLTENYKKKNIIQLIEESILPLDNCSFIIVKKKEQEVYYFDKGNKQLFNHDVLIFGDGRIVTQPYEEILKLSLNKHSKDFIKDQIAFIIHSLSKSVFYTTISSPFTSGADLWEIKKTVVHKYKLKNYFRWEND